MNTSTVSSRPTRNAGSPRGATPSRPPQAAPMTLSELMSRAQQLQAGFQRCSRGLALQVDQAGQGVGTVAGALRPQQYFHLFDVIQHGGGADTGKIDAVDQHAHRRIQRLGKLAGFANAAQLHIACARAAAGHVDVGCIQQNVFQMQCILLLHQ